jgi:predicted metal-dependent HD superfamily phosphohydrolase
VSKPGRYGIENVLSWIQLRPAYWKTLANLRADRSSVTCEGGALRFEGYPFRPATIFPAGTVEPHQVAEVNLEDTQLRLTSGEILFVTSPDKAALLTFVNRNDVQVERRTNVWGALLDPFLDTWEDQATIDRQFDWLASIGLQREAVDSWRREVAPAMYAYNFGTMLWEWCSLGLFDVLKAQQACLGRAAFEDFYRRAMQVAALDQVRAQQLVSGEHTIDSALHSVLLDWYPKDLRGSATDFTERWNVRMEKIGQLQQQLRTELTAAYSEPHRRYHTVQHVEYCLREVSRHWAHAVRLSEIRWALLFHDAIYDTRRNDNEARSAEWACRVMQELQRPADEIERVRKMIFATAHAANADTPDEALLLDIDLSILGAEEGAFDDYDRAIREEYEWVPAPVYRVERAKLLQGFLERERIFESAAYRGLEAAARGNIERALQKLR